MSKIYICTTSAPVTFEVNVDGGHHLKKVNKGEEIIVNGEEISFPNSSEYTSTKFSEVKQYFKRYRSADEQKEIKEFKKQAAIAAMQALIRRQDDTAEHITELSVLYAESLTERMFE